MVNFVTLLVAAAALQASDADLLQTGRFLYRTQVDGKGAGTSEISIQRTSGDFVFTNRVTGEFKQQWEAVATRMFLPISAKLAFGEGDHLSPAFELKYEGGRVTGFRLEKPHSEDSVRLKVNAEVRRDTVDQRIDWAAAMSQELTAEREFVFHVFDPGTGLSRVTGRIIGPETIHVPAGTFDAMRILYRIEKTKGTEEYQVLTNRKGLRVLLKEEFPNGAVTELTEVQATGR